MQKLQIVLQLYNIVVVLQKFVYKSQWTVRVFVNRKKS